MIGESLVGKTCGKFEIRAELGRGGMGYVYKAYQHDLDRIVAIKILRPELTHDPEAVQRFLQEARSAARLEHPHIVPIYEVGTLPSPPEFPTSPPLHAIVMKYIDGKNLKQVIQQQAPGNRLPSVQILDTLTQVGEALDYAHLQEFIHRDIKPSNIMVTKEGWVYLTDFGLARSLSHTNDLTRTGAILGTPEYLSPEQAEGKADLGPASDLYALGIVAYELLSGELPFDADTPIGIAAARLTQTPRPLHEVCPQVSPEVSRVLMRALARNPEHRFASVGDMIMALQEALNPAIGQMVHSPPPATGQTIVLPSSPSAQDDTIIRQARTDHPDQPADSRAYARKQRRMMIVLVSIPLLALILVAGLLIAPFIGTTLLPPEPTIPPMLLTPITPQEEELLDQAWSAFDNQSYARAETLFLQVLDSSHTSAAAASANEGLGWVLRERARTAQDYQAALTKFKTSLAIWEGKASTHNGMGWCFYDMHDYDAALVHFQQATVLAQDYANAYYGKGRTLEELGRLSEARTAYTTVIELEPGSLDAQEAQDGLNRIQVR